MGYEYTTNDIQKVTFFRNKEVEIDHVWVEATGAPEIVNFLTERGFGTNVVPDHSGNGHTLNSAKEYLAKRIASDWKEPN